MSLRQIITADDIVHWANAAVAANDLPALVRRLAHADAEPGDTVTFRAGSGTRLGGWDGFVTSAHGSRYLPKGVSGWELSTAQNIERKADNDFESRSRDHNASSITYIALTARRWARRADWAAEKKELGIWADVRAYDADDLELWLELRPPVAVWFAAALARRATGIMDVDQFLREWSARTKFPLPSSVLIAGRGVENHAVRQWLAGPPHSLGVSGDPPEEASHFVAACISHSDESEREQLLSRTLVVHDHDSWRWILNTLPNSRFILLPASSDFPQVSDNSHHVLIPMQYRPQAKSGNFVALAPIDRECLEQELVRSGFTPHRARRLAHESGGRVGALQRLCGYSATPPWLAEESPALIAILLVGAWEPQNKADAEVIEKLADVPASTVDALCGRLSQVMDAPIRNQVHTWKWRSVEDAWLQLGPRVTQQQLTRFIHVAIQVLEEEDPAYELPQAQRYLAHLEGKIVSRSSSLREGLCKTLFYLGNVHCKQKCDCIAARVLQQILPSGWKAWASVSHLLPMLAESAPLTFLTQLEESLQAGELGACHLFSEEGAPLFGRSPHVPLLWALESLGWLAELLPRVVDALLRLAGYEKTARVANRPSESLAAIFSPWSPQTLATTDERIKILRSVLKRHPIPAWLLLCRILTSRRIAYLTSTHRPLLLNVDIPNESQHDLSDELPLYVDRLVELGIEHAACEVERWVDLISATKHLRADHIERICGGLERCLDARPVNDRWVNVWDETRRSLDCFQRSGDRLEGRSAILARLNGVYERLTPDDPILRNRWLFGARVAVVNEPILGWQEHDERVCRLQCSILEQMMTLENAFSMVSALIDVVERPYAVGRAAASADALGKLEASFVKGALAVDSPFNEALAGYASHRYEESETSLHAILEKLMAAEKLAAFARVATDISPTEALWNVIRALGETAERAYWLRISKLARLQSIEEYEKAVHQLLAVNRVDAAIECASYSLTDPPLPVSRATVVSVLRSSMSGDAILQLGSMADYHLERLLGVLYRTATRVPDDEIVDFEIAFLPVLREGLNKDRHLSKALALEPDRFVTLLGMAYRREDEDNEDQDIDGLDESSEQKRIRARVAQTIFGDWTSYPGESEADADIILERWAREVMNLARSSGLERVAQIQVAEILARAPMASDGAWPAMSARRLVEGGEYQELPTALARAKRNMRGPTVRGLDEGGKQEHELAAQYTRDAHCVAVEWPRVAAMLEAIATSYRADAEHHERRAERFRDP